MEAQRKEVQCLTKALEHSDHYIEDLQQQLQRDQDFTKHGKTHTQVTSAQSFHMNALDATDCLSSGAEDQKRHSEIRLSHQDFLELRVSREKDADFVTGQNHLVKRQLFTSEPLQGMEVTTVENEVQLRSHDVKNVVGIQNTLSSGKSFGIESSSDVMPETVNVMEKNDESFKCDSSGKEKTPTKKVQFNLIEKKSNDASSFDLDTPSPLAPSSLETSVFADKLSVRRTCAESLNKHSYSNNHLPAASNKPQAASSPQSPHEDWCMTNSTRKEHAKDQAEKYSSCKLPLTNNLDYHPSSTSLLQKWKVDADRKGQCFEQTSSSHLSEPECVPQSLIGFGKKASLSKVDGVGPTKKVSRPANSRQSKVTDQERNVSFDLEGPSLDDTQAIQTELNDLDISVTPELSDCLKLLNRAEKKVYSTDSPTLSTQAGTLNSNRICGGQNEMGVKNAKSTAHDIENLHAGRIGLGRGNGDVHASFPRTCIPGATGTMSGWEHGFFSSLRLNSYRHASTLPQLPTTKHIGDFSGRATRSYTPYGAPAEHEKMLVTSNDPNGKTDYHLISVCIQTICIFSCTVPTYSCSFTV